MTLRRFTTGLLSVFFVASAVFVVENIQAQTPEETKGSAIQISPTRNEVSVQAGEQKVISLILKNITSNDIVARVFLNDFESDGTSGTPKILIDEGKTTPYSVKNILKNYSDVELKAGETKEVKVTVEVPPNAAPGAYFGAIRYAAIPKGQNDALAPQVSLTASVAHLVFVEVPGEINQQLKIEKIDIQKNNSSSSIFFSSPNKATVTVKNLGNGFARPFGKVDIQRFGKSVDRYELNNTDPRGIILPSSSRAFTNDIKNVKLPGKYTAVASIAYGEGGEVISYKSTFWYLPIWFVLSLLVLIAAIGASVYLVYKKRYNSPSAKVKRRK